MQITLFFSVVLDHKIIFYQFSVAICVNADLNTW